MLDDAAVKRYEAGEGAKRIGEDYGVSRPIVIRFLRRHGTTIRGRGGSRWRSGPGQLNHAFFSQIQTETQAYWLGFFTADGHIQGNNLSVTLQGSDACHLETLRADVQIANNVAFHPSNRGAATLRWSSPSMVSDLYELGVYERKSWSATPATIPASLQQHYWRGVIDGDGMIITTDSHRYVHLVVGVCGTRAIVDGFLSYCRQLTNTKARTRSVRAKSHFQTSITGTHAHAVARDMYQNATVCLARKRDLWLTHIITQ